MQDFEFTRILLLFFSKLILENKNNFSLETSTGELCCRVVQIRVTFETFFTEKNITPYELKNLQYSCNL